MIDFHIGFLIGVGGLPPVEHNVFGRSCSDTLVGTLLLGHSGSDTPTTASTAATSKRISVQKRSGFSFLVLRPKT